MGGEHRETETERELERERERKTERGGLDGRPVFWVEQRPVKIPVHVDLCM